MGFFKVFAWRCRCGWNLRIYWLAILIIIVVVGTHLTKWRGGEEERVVPSWIPTKGSELLLLRRAKGNKQAHLSWGTHFNCCFLLILRKWSKTMDNFIALEPSLPSIFEEAKSLAPIETARLSLIRFNQHVEEEGIILWRKERETQGALCGNCMYHNRYNSFFAFDSDPHFCTIFITEQFRKEFIP